MPDARTLERLKECSLGHNVYTDGHIRIKTIHDTMFKNLNENMEAFLESRTKILESYLVKGTEEVGMGSDRKKREILPIIFGGIYLAIGGLTEYQIFRINQHVSKNYKAIEEMKGRMNRMEEEITILDEKVIGFITEITGNLKVYFDSFECMEFYEALTNRLTYQVTETMKMIDDILWTALSGGNSLLLTPRMIGIQLLERIVSSNAILRDTVFANHPNLMYSLVNIHLLELKGDWI